YGDYYYGKGAELGLQYGIGQLQFVRRDIFVRPTLFRIFIKTEQEQNAYKNTNFALLNYNGSFRYNPLIYEGRLTSFGFQLNYNYSQERRVSNFGFHVEGEFARPKILNSQFNFNQYYSELRYRTRTLPLWTLDLKASCGYSEGDLPAQRFFSLETSASNTA